MATEVEEFSVFEKEEEREGGGGRKGLIVKV